MEPLNCTGCDHCCRYLTFGINLNGLNKEQIKEKLAYFQTHGCDIVKIGESEWAIVVHSPCKQLMENRVGCRIHAIRPEICKQYDCRKDKFLPKGGRYD